MVSRYDVKSSTWSSHFWVKMHVFPTSFRNGRNKSLWIKWCKVIIYVLFYMLSAKKLLILTVLTWSLILDKIQDGGGDGDHVRWRHRSPAAPPPIKYTWFCGENQRISTEGKKSFRNTATDQKPCGGRGAISLPPPHLYHGWGMTLHVCPRVKYDSLSSWNMTLEFFWTTGFPPFLSRRCDRHKLNFDWANRTFAPLSVTLLKVIHALEVVISCGLCFCLYFWQPERWQFSSNVLCFDWSFWHHRR